MRESGELRTPEEEFALFSRYICGAPPRRELAQRYASACFRLLADAPESKVLPVVLSRPWLIGPLDAGCGILRPSEPFRQRLLIAAAILETTPEFGGSFLPRTHSRLGLVMTLGWHGLRWVVNAVVGIVILFVLLDRFQIQQTTGGKRP
ncbi:MAG: hypothetical protein SFY68_10260 [Candidatus Sumerlaeia bacterium]|nr:hypothetical protein [Candidatus Sumerlaeia bacterium]